MEKTLRYDTFPIISYLKSSIEYKAQTTIKSIIQINNNFQRIGGNMGYHGIRLYHA